MPVYDTFQISVRPAGPASCRVTVAGDLDVASAPSMRDALQAAVADHESIELDCAGLTFVDCCGLSALLAAARMANAYGIELHLLAVPHSLARLLRLSHTGSAFAIDRPSVP
ncbi:STAS domain-containing protein [Streptomyces lunalinharesii]|uniref:Anti-sigma factor antagonist n=1 Tax=Streptomyces lunalinharesii TaxID=333384 RepID=A0ABN3T7P3_9ACTN